MRTASSTLRLQLLSVVSAALAGACFDLATTQAMQPPAAAQPPAPADNKAKPAERDLTDGLLELLTEPPRSTAAPNKLDAAAGEGADKASRKGAPAGGNRTPLGAPRIDGEDLGQPPGGRSNPLMEVQTAMVTVADWLRNKQEAEKTRQLQNDIVNRLDQLIGELDEKPPQSAGGATSPSSSASSSDRTSSPAPSQSQSPSMAPSQSPTGQPRAIDGTDQTGTGRQPAQTEPQGNNNNDLPGGEGKAGQTDGDTPGSKPDPSGNASGAGTPSDLTGRSAPTGIGNRQAVIDLSDPAALQRSAWGNLPERVREQMQSRMVERFLPGYREEIEAYYRALAK